MLTYQKLRRLMQSGVHNQQILNDLDVSDDLLRHMQRRANLHQGLKTLQEIRLLLTQTPLGRAAIDIIDAMEDLFEIQIQRKTRLTCHRVIADHCQSQTAEADSSAPQPPRWDSSGQTGLRGSPQ